MNSGTFLNILQIDLVAGGAFHRVTPVDDQNRGNGEDQPYNRDRNHQMSQLAILAARDDE